MAANAELKIMMNVVTKGDENLRRTERGLRDVDGAAKKSSRSFGDYAKVAGGVTIALGAVIGAAKVAYATISAGAELRATKERFDRLSESIGTTADALLYDLKGATGGLMTDAQLVASATELMSLGLTKSHDETVRLAAVAGQLNWDMQVLGLTLANNSTARLDSLGLSMEVVKKRADELAAAGMSMDAAFDLAVIEAGEEKMELLGNAADTQAGKMQILGNRWSNFVDKLKEFSSDAADPAVDGLLALSTPINDIQTSTAELDANFERIFQQSGSLERFIEQTRDLANPDFASGWYQRRMEAATGEILRFGQGVETLAASSRELYAAQREEARGLERLASVTEAWGGANTKAIENMQTARENTEQTAAAHERYAEAIAASNAEMGQLFAQQTEIADDELLINNTKNQADALFNAAAGANASAYELALLGVATGKFTDEQAEAYLKSAALFIEIERIGRLIAEKKMSVPEGLAALDDFQEGLDATEGDLHDIAVETGLVADEFDRWDGRTVTVDFVTNFRENGTRPTGYGGQAGETGGETGHGDFATGTPSLYGRATVGEFGPEIVQGSGQRIISTNNTRNITQNMSLTGRQSSVTVYNYLRQQSRRKGMVN